MDERKLSTRGLVSLILGLVAIIAWLLPIIGFPITIVGLIFGILGVKAQSKGKAIAGIILNSIFLIFTVINAIIGAIIMAGVFSAM